ncbi:hypothetical protein [Sphingomonas sp. ID0503]|uniref:hypothetical protein n=1 Tax=Sphingomonas sp. ID0503 TaxID=3399691 RepID=UPI003AFAF42B
MRRAPVGTTILAGLFVLLFLGTGFHFAGVQQIWIDESTQLSGSRAPIGFIFKWLAGGAPGAFGVPDDRMPPISYLIDAACWRTVCATPYGLRILHLLIVAAGLAALLLGAARRHGVIAVLAAGVVLAGSSALTEASVEIRAYPIFFALTCLQIVALFRAFDRDRLDAGALVPLVVLGLIAAYTHFFGLVSSMAFFAGLFIAKVRSGREAMAVIAAAAAVVIPSAGLVPFITGAQSISGVEAAGLNMATVTAFALRLVGHAVAGVVPWTGGLLLVAFCVLAAVGVGCAALRGLSGTRQSPLVALVVALAAGLFVTFAAAFVVKGFNPLKPSYNLWMLPVLAMIAAVGAAELFGRRGAGRIVAIGLVAMLTVGATLTQGFFLAHARWFTHGPSSLIAAAIGPDPRGTAVVYRGEWGWGYYPLRYLYAGHADQWLVTDAGTLQRITAEAVGRDMPANALDGYKRVLLVDIRKASYPKLRDPSSQGGSTDAPMPPPEALANFSTVGTEVAPGFYWTNITRFERPRH